MTEEDKQAAAAYIKLHEDVKTLILDTVIEELKTRPYDAFSLTLSNHLATHVLPGALRGELQNYRIVQKGQTAGY